MPHQELVGPPVSIAGPSISGGALGITPRVGNQKRGVLSRIGQGLVAFGANRTASSITAERAGAEIASNQVDIAANQAELGRQEIEANQQATEQQQEMQRLIGVVQQGTGEQSRQAADRLFQLNPELADTLFKNMGATSSAQREDASRRASEILQTAPQDREAVILRQVAEGEAQGRDMSDTLSLIGQSPEDQDRELNIVQSAALSTQQRATGTRGAASKLGQGIVVEGAEGEFAFATPVLGPSGEVETQTTPIAGVPVSRQLAETSARRQQRDIETAGGEVTARAVSKRDQDFIDVGQRQADGTAIIRRGLQLLDIIKTGAPESVALAAKNLFGIAGADETELNANLGKAVLSQLRTTFGAQFTQQEGERLQRLEAGFGKSTAGNKRLLEQTLRLMERDARRGIDAARRNTDPFSADEIEKALQFSLTPGAQQITPAEGEVDPALLEFMTPEQRALFEQ